MSKIWSPTRPVCSPVVLGPGARTVTRWSTGRLLMPVRPPLAGLGSGTAMLTETILRTPGNLTRPGHRTPRNFPADRHRYLRWYHPDRCGADAGSPARDQPVRRHDGGRA